MQQFVIVGLIRKPHGLKGHLTVELLTDTPDAIFASGMRVFAGTVDGDIDLKMKGAGGEPYLLEVESSSYFKDGMVVKFREISDRNTSELWRHRYLLVPFEDLPPLEDGEVFIHDMIGMNVQDTEGLMLGIVSETYELPQGLAFEVKRESGEEVMVLFRDEFVESVDRDSRLIVINNSTGIFE